ncbi:unnamed protein product [Calypogeia fissa]
MSSKSSDTSFRFFGCFRRTFRSHLVAPSSVEEVFRKYAENDVIVPAKFKEFLTTEQGETDVSVEDAEKIIDEQLSHSLLTKGKHALTLDAFLKYLLDPVVNNAYKDKLHQDMTLPASHYYIYTGHNSYLTGNQLNSDCSDKPIMNALNRGVRVIELDLWPNKSNKTEISVLHGGTMTAPVAFETCIVAIRDNAFVASPYPVVITFEDHLTPDLQAKAAEITSRVLGSILYVPDENEKFTEFPSPESMKGRILISTKPPSEYLKGKGHKDAEPPKEAVAEKAGKVEDVAAEKSKKLKPGAKPKPPKEEFDWGDELPAFDTTGHGHGHGHGHGQKEEVPDVAIEEDGAPDNEEGQIDHAVHPAYTKMIAIRAGKPKGSLINALKVDDVVKRVSLSEPQLEKVAEKKPSALIEFTERNLLRIYPYGLRFDSSNYNPLIAWSHGAQMVAFNMQGYGRPLWLVHGFFRANGGCGYVKKPDFLFPTSTGKIFDPRQEVTPKMKLKVKVIMGLGWLEKFGKHYFDTYSPPDFYTRVGIAGVPADTIMKKTEPLEDEWIPKWEKEFEFDIRVPELALLRVEVHEYDMTDKDDFGGQTCLPVSEIEPGFRCISLMDKKGRLLDGVRLLFEFTILPPS